MVFNYGDDQRWGFLELTIGANKIVGNYSAVTTNGATTPDADTFQIGWRTSAAQPESAVLTEYVCAGHASDSQLSSGR